MRCLFVTNTENPHDNGQWIAAAMLRAGVNTLVVHPKQIAHGAFNMPDVDFVFCLGAAVRPGWECLRTLKQSTNAPVALWYFDSIATQDEATTRRRKQIIKTEPHVDHLFLTDGGYDFGGMFGKRLHWMPQGVPWDLYREDLRKPREMFGLGFFGAFIRDTERTAIIENIATRVPLTAWGRLQSGYKSPVQVGTDVRGRDLLYTASSCKALLAAEATFGYVKDYWSNRLYLMAGTGVPTFARDIPGIRKEMGIDGGHVRYYDSADDAVDLYHWMERNIPEAKAMGDRCRKFVLDKHTYDNRVKRILKTMGVTACATK